jgi:hypothetical protein
MVALISLYLYRQVKIERIQRVDLRMGHLAEVGLWVRESLRLRWGYLHGEKLRFPLIAVVFYRIQ